MAGRLNIGDPAQVRVPQRDGAPTRWQHVVLAIKIAVVGGVAVATVECVSSFLVKARHLEGGWWTIRLFAASLGKAAITHLMVWCPLMALCALATRWLIRGRGSDRRPEPIFTALFVAMAGLVVVPADLELIGGTTSLRIALACAAVLIASIIVYVLLGILLRLITERLARLLLTGFTCGALVLTVVSGGFFVRSPLFNPATFRVGNIARVDQTSERLNVLWIVLDTVRPDRMSVYDSERDTTPFLRQWSSDGIIFDRAISSGMWTVPAHASMFTGLSLRQHGVGHKHAWLDDDFSTVADVLGASGYRTAAFSANPWVSRETNLLKGFDVVNSVYHLKHLSRFSLEALCEKWGVTPPLPWLDRDFGAGLANQMATEWIGENADGSTPFFLFVNYLDAHLPYISPSHYRRMFMTSEQVDRSYDLRQRIYGNIVQAMDMRFNLEGSEFMSQQDRTVLKLQYESAIRYLDDRVAELIGMIKQRGLLDNTLVVVCSDHGEYLDTHGMWSHRFLTYADLTHVALIIHDPRSRSARRITTPVQLGDIYQTVLNAALNTSGDGKGFGATDLLAIPQEGQPDRIAISEWSGPPQSVRERMKKLGRERIKHSLHSQIAVQDVRFKMIVSSDGSQELYDLSADPGELRDIAATMPDEVRRLAGFITHWIKNVPGYEFSTDAPELDSDMIKALRSLGYVDH